MAIATFTIALAGNPNSGKSTLFNALTGAHQHTGNWPGVTVEKKQGTIHLNGQHIAVVDLPGAYSLSAYSAEELITRDFILDTGPDVVVAVVDASNLERNLYLVVQLLEMGAPVVMALNMTDVAERRHIHIDTEKLAKHLNGIPIIATVGNRELGVATLKNLIARNIQEREVYPPFQILFDPEIEQEIARLVPLIEQDARLNAKYPVRWLAIKLLEEDEEMLRRVRHNPAISQMAMDAVARIQQATQEDADTLIVDSRYRFIAELVGASVTRPRIDTVTTSDRIDQVLAHRFWGVPIFLFFMWIVFQVTANVSAPLLDWVDGLISGPVSRWAVSILTVLGAQESWVGALVIDGVIAGVGGVLVFIPVLASLYMAIAVLEESGYMARAAFVMERFMLALGLHGKSFLPMLVGFGCTVPAIYATRTLEDELDRKITGFLTPFMSCGARLPVYVVFGAAFFGGKAGNLIFGMYATGILVAILTSLLMTRLVFRERTVQPFVIELPPYRIPDGRAVLRSIGDHLGQFLRNAGTVIFAASVVIWFLMATPVKPGEGRFNEVESTDSVFGSISRAVAPVLEPAGFGTWEASSSLMTGLLAKEVIISTMSQIYVAGAEDNDDEDTPTFVEDVEEIAVSFGEATVLTAQELVNIIPRTVNALPGVQIREADFLGTGAEESRDTGLEAALREVFTPLQAVAFNVFVLLYVPCMATVAAMRQEFGSRWMAYQAIYMVAVAWIGATVVYQGGLLLGWG